MTKKKLFTRAIRLLFEAFVIKGLFALVAAMPRCAPFLKLKPKRAASVISAALAVNLNKPAERPVVRFFDVVRESARRQFIA